MHTKKIIIIKSIVVAVILMCLICCDKREDKYFYDKARDDFIKYIIPDIRENWHTHISNAFQLKKSEDKRSKELWDFWADIFKAPDKYIAKTTKGDVFLEYRIETFDSDDSFGMYSFAMVEMMFVKDDCPGWFRIFFLYSPQVNRWKTIDFEFSYPSTFTFNQLKR